MRGAPVIVGVDGSARSIDALVLADALAAALRTRLVIAYVHSLGNLSSVFSEDEHELIVRGVAESTFEQIRDYLPSVPERRLQLISEQSPAAGLHVLAEREQAALMVVGSSHRSNIGRILVGCTAERLLTGASVPVAVAPAGYSTARRSISLWALPSTARRSPTERCVGGRAGPNGLCAAPHRRRSRARLGRDPRSERWACDRIAQRHPAAPARRAACRSRRSARSRHRCEPDARGRGCPRPAQRGIRRSGLARTGVTRIRTDARRPAGERLDRTTPFSPLAACRRTPRQRGRAI